ncbi:acyl-CoA dehydrogenase family protein [Sphingosinicella sp. LHD-64]|uniref:acyl-CoA dehydrogenase family protein n=1 Tax=Sphingosinicella sp. LHD-64 TaxID=3072139 RepID=UPI00280CD8B2|nr:acyl-CoA dehydrogenase family protein [Sphingosinicella sp. LHD-64]MDQ8757609.1 acyl-CoA dehydrogenase family protein [Sphingosinicella sp. LHD-64]
MIVDLLPSEEQQLIDDSVRALLAERLPVERLRETASHGGAAERAAWGDFVALGLFGIGIAEADGGHGLGAAEEALVARALGRHLVSLSVLAQMAAPHLATDDALRTRLISGETRATFATVVDQGTAQRIDGDNADWLILLGEGVALVDVPAEAAPIACLDETVSLARLDGSFPAFERADSADRISLLLAAYLSGIAQATLDMAVAYAATREQFGQPIGAFQAIKHMCADMAVRGAAAEAQVLHAAVAFGAGLDDRAEVACARLLATDAALRNANANIQIHGAMGFTAECDAHLYLKRARLVSVLGSSRQAEQERLLAGVA